MTAMAGSVELRWGNERHRPRRSNNQDHYLAREDVGLWAVADGMGGRRGGEIASAVACEAIDQRYASHTVDGLVGAVEAANAFVYRRGSDIDLAGMGTTIVAIALVDDGRGEPVLAIANVGDSRAYRLAGLEARAADGRPQPGRRPGARGAAWPSPEEAAVHPQRNILLQVLGVYDDVPVDHVTVVPTTATTPCCAPTACSTRCPSRPSPRCCAAWPTRPTPRTSWCAWPTRAAAATT